MGRKRIDVAGRVYAAVWRCWRDQGHAPTVGELCAVLVMDSLDVRSCLAQLEEGGFIVWDSHTDRGITIYQEPPP